MIINELDVVRALPYPAGLSGERNQGRGRSITKELESRHCERSEATQPPRPSIWVASPSARNDVKNTNRGEDPSPAFPTPPAPPRTIRPRPAPAPASCRAPRPVPRSRRCRGSGRPAFMSAAPRPYMRPPRRRLEGRRGPEVGGAGRHHIDVALPLRPRSMSFVTVCCREAEDQWRIPPHLPVRAWPCPSLLSRRMTACGRKTLWINARARPGRCGRVSRRRSARATCENLCIAEFCHGGQRPASDLRRPMSANVKLRNRCTRWKADGHIIRSRC